MIRAASSPFHYTVLINPQHPFTLANFHTKHIFIKNIRSHLSRTCPAVFRNPSDLSFETIFVDASKRVFQIEERPMNIINKKSDPKEGLPLVRNLQRTMHSTMAVGKSLLDMNARALNSFADFLNDIGTESQRKNFYRWVRDSFTISSAAAVYGPENPISEDESLIQSATYVRFPFLRPETPL